MDSPNRKVRITHLNITYVQYVKGTSKGQSNAGDMVNSVYQLGVPEPEYTGDAITETMTAGATQLAWGKVVKNVFVAQATYRDGGHIDAPQFMDIKLVPDTPYAASSDKCYYAVLADDNARMNGDLTGATWYRKEYIDPTDPTKGEKFVAETGAYTIVADDKIAYRYDNVVVPQETLPTLKAEVTNIPLMARARRIAVFYSQIAAFQA